MQRQTQNPTLEISSDEETTKPFLWPPTTSSNYDDNFINDMIN